MIGWLLRFIVKIIVFFTVKLAILFWPITLAAGVYAFFMYLN